jgi:hypothetical protein
VGTGFDTFEPAVLSENSDMENTFCDSDEEIFLGPVTPREVQLLKERFGSALHDPPE